MLVAITGILAQLVIALFGILLTWRSDVIDPKEITRKITDEIQDVSEKALGNSEALLSTLLNLPKTVADKMRKKRRLYNALFVTMILAVFLQIFELYSGLNYFARDELEQALKNHRIIQKARVYEQIRDEVIFRIGPEEKFKEKIMAFRSVLDEPIREIFAQCSVNQGNMLEIINPKKIKFDDGKTAASGFERHFSKTAKDFSSKIANEVFLKHFYGFIDSPVFKHMDAPLKISPVLIPVLSSTNFATWVEEKENRTSKEVQCDRSATSLYEALSCALEENLASDVPKCVFSGCYQLAAGLHVNEELTQLARRYCQMKGITMEPETKGGKSIFASIYDRVWESVRVYDTEKLVEDYFQFKDWYDPIFGGV